MHLCFTMQQDPGQIESSFTDVLNVTAGSGASFLPAYCLFRSKRHLSWQHHRQGGSQSMAFLEYQARDLGMFPQLTFCSFSRHLMHKVAIYKDGSGKGPGPFSVVLLLQQVRLVESQYVHPTYARASEVLFLCFFPSRKTSFLPQPLKPDPFCGFVPPLSICSFPAPRTVLYSKYRDRTPCCGVDSSQAGFTASRFVRFSPSTPACT